MRLSDLKFDSIGPDAEAMRWVCSSELPQWPSEERFAASELLRYVDAHQPGEAVPPNVEDAWMAFMRLFELDGVIYRRVHDALPTESEFLRDRNLRRAICYLQVRVAIYVQLTGWGDVCTAQTADVERACEIAGEA